ncbi:MAG: HEAT repeat domain-containing protein [Bryobacterales bacterium]|nr:HEAT repeat domain-containing protein [Bryobacterales bacterium]MDE0294710.1 HEAT repeat domain-containing protein [Bryobacterales bacterium]
MQAKIIRAMGLFDIFRPKWKHANPDVRIAAARELPDIGILQKMATDDRDWFVRHRVFDEIRDRQPGDSVYAHLAKHSLDEEIRRKAVKKLKDEAVLEDVSSNDQFRYIRDAASHRLDELRRNTYGEKSEPQSAKPAG